MFMLAAAGLFAGVETWSYDEALYYTFITLTTIGLGDYVPGETMGSLPVLEVLFSLLFL